MNHTKINHRVGNKKSRWIILDWAGNLKFNGQSFNSIDAASDFLSEQIELLYPETKNNEEEHNEVMDQYQFIKENEHKGL